MRQTSVETPQHADGDKFAISAPSLSLPKGGGAIRGMGEKFAANPVSGSGSMSVPIVTSPGRSGFGPQLSLSYDSGGGNGPFGFGWSLSLPAIVRKTDRGLPQYRDDEESDVFMLSGAEDLVPLLQRTAAGNWIPQELPARAVAAKNYRIRRYRPRIEGLFARIERWTNADDPHDVHWRSISKDNILTLYGKDAGSRVHDPADPRRIFTWLICESRDDKGNAILYEYKPEDGQGVSLNCAHEFSRGEPNAPGRTANRYIKRIRYGNRVPMLDDNGQRPDLLTTKAASDGGWMFDVVFDYGEHHPKQPTPDDAWPWRFRVDPFSSYRSGFEVRTTRLCERVLMFHHFPGESDVGIDCLVRSTDFTYSDEIAPQASSAPAYSFLRRIGQSGYKRCAADLYQECSLPPVEFQYSEPAVQHKIEDIDPESLEDLPVGLDGSTYRWTDLHGEGVSGILAEQAGAWYYKQNLSAIPTTAPDGKEEAKVSFGPAEEVAFKPNASLKDGAEFMDLAGDGQPDVVIMDGQGPGLYEHDEAGGWQPFRPFGERLNRSMRNPNLRFIDLDGDGHADVLITENEAFIWHASLAETGFGPARRVAKAMDEENGPRVIFADDTQSIYLADMSGDGLTDIVRIRNHDICYWPNLGYGRFGAKVTMDNAPWFDRPEQFDQKRIRLADIDGSGTVDIIYLHREGVHLYFNQSGNGWSARHPLQAFPPIDNVASIVPMDLLGNGTACLVWSSPLSGDMRRPMRYVNLMGTEKPHLLSRTWNNLGAETHVKYVPSTRFYLQDKRAGRPWITRLPFPVHVVERVETWDHIGKDRFITRYAYHHGFFDGEEREFRGFGMVEQWDTEHYAALSTDGEASRGGDVAEESHVPAIHTKTWFHTGAYLGRERISRHFEREYFREPDLTMEVARQMLLEDTILPDGLTMEDEREACRALKGSMLRQEVYADDAGHPGATPDQVRRACTPYSVTEQNFTIELLQAKGGNRHAVFFSHAREAISFHYERNPADPRVQHAFTLEVDAFGNVLKSVAVAYGRRPGQSPLLGEDRRKQEQTLVSYTENGVTNAIDETANYRVPLPCLARSYEITGLQPAGSAGRFTFGQLADDACAALPSLEEIGYEQPADYGRLCKRPIECMQTLYRRNDLTGLLPSGELQSMALPGESRKLAFTAELARETYVASGKLSQAELEAVFADEGRYAHGDGDADWWISSGRVFYSDGSQDSAAIELAEARTHFFLPRRYRDPFGNESIVDFDEYDLLLQERRDAIGNRVTVGERDIKDELTRKGNDYRVLQPRLVSDPNRNRTEVAYDLLGMVAGTAVMGKPEEDRGDRLDSFRTDLAPADIEALYNPTSGDPHDAAPGLLGEATTRIVYDLHRFWQSRRDYPDQPDNWQAPFAVTLARETHVSDLQPGQKTRIQISFSYSDGFGREIQKKIQAESGPVPRRDQKRKVIVGYDGRPQLTDYDASPRWVGSGWTVFNNKGKPVRQFEPFFSDTHRMDFDARIGVSPVLFYDPAGRVVATLHPNHTYEKVVFDAWQQTTWDVNDTVRERDANGKIFDPKNDADVGQYFARLPDEAYLPTWHDLRMDAAKALAAWPDADATGKPLPENAGRRATEMIAAKQAANHADTPTTAHFDALGRPFVTIARNRTRCSGHALDGTEECFATRVELDIEGNQREVRDERKLADTHGLPVGALEQRVVMRYAFDMLGNRIHQLSMEAGGRWMLNDAAGKPIRSWDGRGHEFKTQYDVLLRPVAQYVRGTSDASDPRTQKTDPLLIDKIEYGESIDNAEALNLRTRVYRHSDTAGVVVNALLDDEDKPAEAYDFKGNLLHGSRQFIRNYKALPDWNGPVDMEQDAAGDAQRFVSRTEFDALNRPTATTSPDGSIYRPAFNEANLLDKVDVNLRGAKDANGPVWTPFVTNIDYDAKGQRELIEYGSGAGGGRRGVTTAYEYDPDTFRLLRLTTTRPANLNGLAQQLFQDSATVQDLRYTYDPAGNIMRIGDEALAMVHYDGQQVESACDYAYDALYRLIQATGREHVGQAAFLSPAANGNFRDYPYIDSGAGNDAQALRNYTERYIYDAVGNFLAMAHKAKEGDWTRNYSYCEASLIEPAKVSNRLSKAPLQSGLPPTKAEFSYDLHGNMTRMPHLPLMQWDYRDQLLAAAQQLVNDGTPETTWYLYDASGQRVRKVTECYAAAGQVPKRMKERVYVGGFELYREYESDGVTLELERETLHVMDDKQRIAMVETRTQGNEPGVPSQLVRYQFGNHLGSASLELDETGALVAYEEYRPYGTSSFQAGRSAAEVSLKRYRYTGKERDDESGLYYHGARYYAAWLGKWVSTDPLGVRSRHENLYEYVLGNPTVLRDPSGEAESASVLEEVVMGDFHGGETTWVGVLANVGVGLIPGVGQIADARDTAAAAKNLWDEPSLGNAGVLGMAIVGWVPGIGDAIKGTGKVGKKVVTEVAEKAAKEAAEKAGEKEAAASAKTIKGSSKPEVGEALVGSSRRQMRDAAAKRIAADPDHPLKFLLDEKGQFKKQVGLSHAELADRPDLVQMGHIQSNKTGGKERLMLQGAWENQFNNVTIESPHIGGAVLDQPAVEIGGIAVDLKTANSWEEFGFLKQGTVNASPRIVP